MPQHSYHKGNHAEFKGSTVRLVYSSFAGAIPYHHLCPVQELQAALEQCCGALMAISHSRCQSRKLQNLCHRPFFKLSILGATVGSSLPAGCKWGARTDLQRAEIVDGGTDLSLLKMKTNEALKVTGCRGCPLQFLWYHELTGLIAAGWSSALRWVLSEASCWWGGGRPTRAGLNRWWLWSPESTESLDSRWFKCILSVFSPRPLFFVALLHVSCIKSLTHFESLTPSVSRNGLESGRFCKRCTTQRWRRGGTIACTDITRQYKSY